MVEEYVNVVIDNFRTQFFKFPQASSYAKKGFVRELVRDENRESPECPDEPLLLNSNFEIRIIIKEDKMEKREREEVKRSCNVATVRLSG